MSKEKIPKNTKKKKKEKKEQKRTIYKFLLIYPLGFFILN